jgi:hypothetical protein
MKTANDITHSVDDLAGHWTEPALHFLKGAGIHPISVDLEVETWRTLERVLRAEVGFRRSFRLPTAASLSRLKERTIRKAAKLVARKFGFPSAFTETEEVEARRLPRQTDFTPGWRPSVLGVAL